tara:strand:+ start:1467 stop:1769 length:303 start_codon:yes stop_codon:yes gene_type:complete
MLALAIANAIIGLVFFAGRILEDGVFTKEYWTTPPTEDKIGEWCIHVAVLIVLFVFSMIGGVWVYIMCTNSSDTYTYSVYVECDGIEEYRVVKNEYSRYD